MRYRRTEGAIAALWMTARDGRPSAVRRPSVCRPRGQSVELVLLFVLLVVLLVELPEEASFFGVEDALSDPPPDPPPEPLSDPLPEPLPEPLEDEPVALFAFDA